MNPHFTNTFLFPNSEPPTICYKYNKHIKSTLFNFNKLVSDLDIHANTPQSEEQEGKPQETDSIKSQISFKTSRGKRTAQKDATKDTTNDSQMNRHLPHRRPPAVKILILIIR